MVASNTVHSRHMANLLSRATIQISTGATRRHRNINIPQHDRTVILLIHKASSSLGDNTMTPTTRSLRHLLKAVHLTGVTSTELPHRTASPLNRATAPRARTAFPRHTLVLRATPHMGRPDSPDSQGRMAIQIRIRNISHLPKATHLKVIQGPRKVAMVVMDLPVDTPLRAATAVMDRPADTLRVNIPHLRVEAVLLAMVTRSSVLRLLDTTCATSLMKCV